MKGVIVYQHFPNSSRSSCLFLLLEFLENILYSLTPRMYTMIELLYQSAMGLHEEALATNLVL